MKQTQDSASGLPAPKYNMAPHFARGVSMSWYPAFLKLGAIYRDANGAERDLFDILVNDYGIDTLCLQVFLGDASNVPWYGGGIDADYCLQLATEAQKHGMRIMLSLILGSGWNNAGIQTKPVAWHSLSYDALKATLYDYVYQTARKFIDNGITPEWIKIGNEANKGILLPDGSTDDYEKLSELYSVGHDAIKAANPAIHSMIHLSNCEQTDYMLQYFKNLQDHHCRYDMVALSFYPYSASKEIPDLYEALRATLCELTEKIRKPIMIVECGFDNFKPELGYNEFLRMLQIISESPILAQTGIVYWEPEMINSLYSAAYSDYFYNAWQDNGRPSRIMDGYLAISERK